jgi:DNA-binding MarR family transcriptional regulator
LDVNSIRFKRASCFSLTRQISSFFSRAFNTSVAVDGQKHSIYQKDIEKEFGLRPSTATEVLKALEKKELICRVSEKQDARLKRIEFTSKAEEIRHLIAAEIGESESILLKGITEEERQIFIAIGERMLKNLDEANQ